MSQLHLWPSHADNSMNNHVPFHMQGFNAVFIYICVCTSLWLAEEDLYIINIALFEEVVQGVL